MMGLRPFSFGPGQSPIGEIAQRAERKNKATIIEMKWLLHEKIQLYIYKPSINDNKLINSGQK